jgi:hypothetical protein
MNGSKPFANAETIPLDSIQKALTVFVRETEDWPWEIDDFSSTLIIDLKKDKNILECREGVFLVILLSSSSYSHFLLVDDNSFHIVNMRNSFTEIIETVLDFFGKNAQYSRDDILFYIKEIIRIDKLNKKTEHDHMNHWRKE